MIDNITSASFESSRCLVGDTCSREVGSSQGCAPHWQQARGTRHETVATTTPIAVAASRFHGLRSTAASTAGGVAGMRAGQCFQPWLHPYNRILYCKRRSDSIEVAPTKSQGIKFYDTFARFNRASAPPPSSAATPSDVSPLFPNTAAGTCFCVISISRMGIVVSTMRSETGRTTTKGTHLPRHLRHPTLFPRGYPWPLILQE